MTSNGKRICKNCGFEVPADMKQCPHCGWLLEDEEDFELPSLDDDPAEKKQADQSERLGQTEDNSDFSRRASAHSSRSFSQRQQNHSYDEYYHQQANRPTPRHAAPDAFTDLDIKDLPIQETTEMKKLEQEERRETKQYEFHQEEHRPLEETLYDPSEYEEETEKTSVKQKSQPKKKKNHKRKNNHHSVLPAILLFIVLTLALLAGGVYLVDHFSGGSLISSFNGRKSEKTAEVTAEPEETAEATAIASAAAIPSATPTPTATPDEHAGYVGHLTVTTDVVRVRNSASLSGTEVGSATYGQEYDVIATADADGYTWYEIGENQWMPSDGTWAEYTQY